MKKLKSAEEYLKEFFVIANLTTTEQNKYTSMFKQIQLDTIQTTVENCAEEAEADFEPLGWLAEQHMNSPFIEGEDYEVPIIRISILEVADKMKEELK